MVEARREGVVDETQDGLVVCSAAVGSPETGVTLAGRKAMVSRG